MKSHRFVGNLCTQGDCPAKYGAKLVPQKEYIKKRPKKPPTRQPNPRPRHFRPHGPISAVTRRWTGAVHGYRVHRRKGNDTGRNLEDMMFPKKQQKLTSSLRQESTLLQLKFNLGTLDTLDLQEFS